VFCETSDERFDIEHGEGKFDRTDPVAAVGKRSGLHWSASRAVGGSGSHAKWADRAAGAGCIARVAGRRTWRLVYDRDRRIGAVPENLRKFIKVRRS
jgi:hypothetical protein